MNEKLRRIKRSIKHYTPELIVAASVVAGAVALKYLIASQNETGEMLDGIILPDAYFDMLNEQDGAFLLQLDQGDFLLTKSTI